ncbi:MAG: hypothetical protein COB37_05080 [Kordiimonadales bacterium]|nr:MAG: hypothetical protein COB37_05080 [Kordiimonadales bacterium]
MYKNYLVTALRSFARHKLFSFINITGLAIGLAAFILILLFVRDQYNWDQNWHRSADTYKLETTLTYPDRDDRVSPGAVDPLKDLFLATYPEVEDITRYLSASMDLRLGDNLFREPAAFADPNIIDFFQFEFVEGNAEGALLNLNSIVITERLAAKLFPGESALGKVVTSTVRETQDYRIAGVIKDFSHNSHFSFEIIVPFSRDYFVGRRWFTEDWRFPLRRSYVRFKKGTDVAGVTAQLPALIEQHMPQETGGQETGRGRGMILNLIGLKDLHIYRMELTGDLATLQGFLVVGLLILVIAVVNFLNLSMARTSYRAREVALRKTVGASPRQVLVQFLTESVVLALVSLVIALALVELALPYYNDVLASVIEFDLFSNPLLLAGLTLLGIVVGLSAGSLHATYFAVLKPSSVLQGNGARDGGKQRFRTALVVGQFTIAIALMTTAYFVTKQTEYARTLNLGFDKENLVVLSGTNGQDSDAIKAKLLESPFILSVGRSSDVPTEGSEDRLQMRPVAGGDMAQLDGLPTGPDFFKVYNIPMLAGRPLDASVGVDNFRTRETREYREAVNIVINAAGARLLGFASPEAAIGQTIRTNLTSDFAFDATIVGVSADFHFDSARDVIRPGIYYLDEFRRSDMSIRIDAANIEAAQAAIGEAWQVFFPGQVMQTRSMAEMVERQYQGDARIGNLLTAFTVLAIIISCLGLFGMASFTVERRTKEIGIRKVLGARYGDISLLLLWQFSKPILVAVAAALPIALYISNEWLSGFAYRIELSPWPLLLISSAVLVIGWATVAGHAFKVARANPIRALRYE